LNICQLGVICCVVGCNVSGSRLRCFLNQRPDIEWVWVDWCCLPQG